MTQMMRMTLSEKSQPIMMTEDQTEEDRSVGEITPSMEAWATVTGQKQKPRVRKCKKLATVRGFGKI